jgi:hypothetical protein
VASDEVNHLDHYRSACSVRFRAPRRPDVELRPTVPEDWSKAQHALGSAFMAGDAQTWSQYIAGDWQLVDADGEIKSKAQRAAEIKARGPFKTNLPFQLRPIHFVRVYGNTVVEVFSRYGVDRLVG